MALVEFGDQAYVITPFTSDYDNILLSIALIRDPVEFSLFPNRGTVIARAAGTESVAVQGIRVSRGIRQPDGDLHRRRRYDCAEWRPPPGRRSSRARSSTRCRSISSGPTTTRRFGDIIPDQAWTAAVAKTGGRFYAVSNERDLIRAIERHRPRLGRSHSDQALHESADRSSRPFALWGAALWAAAAVSCRARRAHAAIRPGQFHMSPMSTFARLALRHFCSSRLDCWPGSAPALAENRAATPRAHRDAPGRERDRRAPGVVRRRLVHGHRPGTGAAGGGRYWRAATRPSPPANESNAGRSGTASRGGERGVSEGATRIRRPSRSESTGSIRPCKATLGVLKNGGYAPMPRTTIEFIARLRDSVARSKPACAGQAGPDARRRTA